MDWLDKEQELDVMGWHLAGLSHTEIADRTGISSYDVATCIFMFWVSWPGHHWPVLYRPGTLPYC